MINLAITIEVNLSKLVVLEYGRNQRSKLSERQKCYSGKAVKPSKELQIATNLRFWLVGKIGAEVKIRKETNQNRMC